MRKKSVDNAILDCQTKNFALRERKCREVRKYGISAKGQAFLIKHYQGQKLSASQAIKAYCYSCMGFYADGKNDCEDPLCPLYPWYPYRNNPLVDANRALPAKNSDALVCSNPTQSGNANRKAGERS